MYLKQEFFEYTKDCENRYRILKENTSMDELLRLSELRKINVDYLKEFVYVKSESILGEVFVNRYVYPMRDIMGNIVGFVGYSNESEPKYYFYSTKWVDKWKLPIGIHNIDLIFKYNTIIVVEGLFDKIRLDEAGFANSIALNGTKLDELVKSLIKKIDKKVLIVDRDEAGIKFMKSVRDIFDIIIYPSLGCKDIDEVGKVFGSNYINEALNNILKYNKVIREVTL